MTPTSVGVVTPPPATITTNQRTSAWVGAWHSNLCHAPLLLSVSSGRLLLVSAIGAVSRPLPALHPPKVLGVLLADPARDIVGVSNVERG